MEFIHDDIANRCIRPFGQCHVCQDFRRAAKDGRIPIHRCVSRGDADIFRTKITTQGEEFFVHQSLNRTGVNAAFALGHGFEMQSRGNERFTRSGWGIENHIVPLEQFQNGLLLGWIQFQFPFGDIIQKTIQHLLA